MLRTHRSLVALGAAGALGAPAAVALAQEPEAPAGPGTLRASLSDEPTVRAEMRDHQHERLLVRYRQAVRRVDREPSGAARFWSNGRLRTEIRALRAERRERLAERRERAAERRRAARAAKAARAAGVSTSTTGATAPGAGAPSGALAAIAQCESGGNPSAVGGGGTYRGLFQFSQATWNAVGGTGDPAAASVGEQTKRAQILYAQAGPSQWPVCGR